MGLQPAAERGSIRLPNEWIPRPYQWAAWKYLAAGGRHCELLWHRRGGKDELALHHTAVSAWRKVGNYWHMLPMAEQARKALWNAVNPHTGKRRIDEAFPQEMRAGYNDHEMLIRFRNGSAWQVVGSDNFNSLVGSPPIGLVFSEWPLCDPAAWAYLMPIMEENGGWVIFNGTPRGRNHAYRSLRSAQMRMAAGRDAFAQVLDATQTGVFSEQQLERIRAQLIETYGSEFGQSIYEQEYLCSFDAANMGAILGRYVTVAEREGRVSDDVTVDPEGAPLEISSDIGFRDTAAWWFWQPKRDGFALVKYDSDSGLDAGDWIDRLTGQVKKLGVKLGRIWLPNDAKAKTFATRHSPMEQFLGAFGADVVRTVPQTKKLDQINAARSVIGKCQFSKTACKEGLEGLAAWSFVYDEETKDFSKDPKHDWASHPGDGFAYGALIMREREAATARPKTEAERVREIRGITVDYPGMDLDAAGNIAFPKPTLDEMWNEIPRPSARV